MTTVPDIAIMTTVPDGKKVVAQVRPVHAWAWVHTLRTGTDPTNMQEILEWAQDEMGRVGVAKEQIENSINNEVAHYINLYKGEFIIEPEPPDEPEIA